MPDPTPAEEAQKWLQAGEQFVQGGLETFLKANLTKGIISGTGDVVGNILGVIYTLLAPIGIGMAEGMTKAEDLIAPAFSQMAAAAVRDVFNVEVSPTTFAQPNGRGARADAGNALGRGFIEQILGTSKTLEPTDAGALRYITAMSQMALEDWFKGWFFEVLSSLVPQLDIGKIESYGALGDKVVKALGLEGASRRVLRPYVDTAIVTPTEWYVNKLYRPTLLTAAACARQIARKPDQREKWTEELRRQGWSDERIEVLLTEQRRFFSASDVRLFVTRGWWDNDRGLKHLRDQGYDESTATDAIRVEGLRRIEQIEQQEANAIISAYVARDIDRATFGSMLNTAVSPPSERALLTELAEIRLACNVKRLSLSQVEAMVKSKVLNYQDYRRAAEREGYPPDDVAALELHLRWEIDKATDLAELRAAQAAERAREKVARDAAAAVRRAEIEAQRALARRGNEADLEAAAVRGLIPLARVAEVYAAHYDADTVQILLDELTDRRADYVARQQAADEARKRAAVRNVDVGTLERAVLEHVLTLDQFRAMLRDRLFAPEDADILTDTVAARLDALEHAQLARDQAAAAAKVKHLDLGRMETLVRRGHRTLRDHDAFLGALGFDDAARAAMGELLQLRIDDDAAAAQLRADAAAADAARGLTLEQFRRAVIIGVTPLEAFVPFLIDQGYTVPAANVLRAELEFDVDEATAAAARRADADRRSMAGRLSLSVLRRAARLGLVPVETYYTRLRAEGYSDDEVAIEGDLLAAEIGSDRALQAAADARAAAVADRELSLAQLRAAVLAGAAPIAIYTDRALVLGFNRQDADTLTRTLQAAVDTRAAAERRRQELAAESAQRELSRADVEKAVRQGLKTIDEYFAWLVSAGYADDDAWLLTAELRTALEAATNTGNDT